MALQHALSSEEICRRLVRAGSELVLDVFERIIDMFDVARYIVQNEQSIFGHEMLLGMRCAPKIPAIIRKKKPSQLHNRRS